MCAILDADVAHQVFGKERPPAGEAFFDWVNSGGMRLVVGGKLLAELDNDARFRIWRQQASQAGRVEVFNAQRIEARTADLRNEGGQSPAATAAQRPVPRRIVMAGALTFAFSQRGSADMLSSSPPGRLRDWVAGFTYELQVCLDGCRHIALRFLDGTTGGGASRQVRGVCGAVSLSCLDDDDVFATHGSCSSIGASVPITSTSSAITSTGLSSSAISSMGS